MRNTNLPYVAYTGDLQRGFTFYGPFPDASAAIQASQSWDVAPLLPPGRLEAIVKLDDAIDYADSSFTTRDEIIYQALLDLCGGEGETVLAKLIEIAGDDIGRQIYDDLGGE